MSYQVGILSGGKSSRMGKNKAFLEYEKQSFLEKIIDEFTGTPITVSADCEGKYERICRKKAVSLVYDTHREIGPIEGIYQILTHAEEPYVFLCAVDMPFLKKELADYLYQFVSSDYDCICIQEENQIHPLCAIYSRNIIPQVEALIAEDKHRLTELLTQIRTKYVALSYTCFDKKIVRNINTKEEYKQCLLPIIFAVSGTKNTGKTTLIEKLIPKFNQENYKVGVLKHDGHDYTIDHPGTDTARYTKAGAQYSAIYSKTQYTIQANLPLKKEQLPHLIRQLTQADIIILEGQKTSEYPKIEVIRTKKTNSPPIEKNSPPKENLQGEPRPASTPPHICFASDEAPLPHNHATPTYHLNDIDGIYQEIKQYFSLPTQIPEII